MQIIKNLAFIILITGCSSNGKDSERAEVDVAMGQTISHQEDPWTIEYLMGKFEPSADSNFTLIEEVHADRAGLYLRKDAYQAFKDMYHAAREDGIELVIRSATRNFDYQKGIWERKWKGETALEGGVDGSTIADKRLRAQTILRYSSMPGTSRHHWGTDIDLNSFSNRFFEQGEGLKIYTWLLENARDFGFCQPYTAKGTGRPYGYEEEKWHWSYLPISQQLTRKAKEALSPHMIQGFPGAEESESLQVIDHYILGIDSSCMTRLSD